MNNPLPLKSALDVALMSSESARVDMARMFISAGFDRPEYLNDGSLKDRAVATVRGAFDLAYRDGAK
jgi:hypothetical protein